MAEQVQLTGYQGPTGFRPEQTYDPSRQILQQGQQITDQLERYGQRAAQRQESDLEALAKFSSTLTSTIQDYQKKQNENEYNLGLADVMNGNVELPETVYDSHDQQVGLLQQTAAADGEVANNLETNGQLVVGQEFRSQSPAIKGWRAYGQAVGLAKKAALGTQAFLTEFMEKTEAIIPTPDGLKSPAQIRSEGSSAEIEATLIVAQQEYFRITGLSAINPVVLAENFAPTFQAAKEQIKANTIISVAANRRESAEYEILNRTKINAVAQTDINALGISFQQDVQDMQIMAGLSKGKANDVVLVTMLKAIELLPPDQARAALRRLSKVAKFPGDPNSTLGKLHGDFFRQTSQAIQEKELGIAQRQEQEANKQLQQLVSTLELARSNEKDPIKLRQIETEALRGIKSLANISPEARMFLAKENLNRITPEETTRFNRALDQKLSLDQIEALDLSEDKKEILRKQATDSTRTQFERDNSASIRQSTQSFVKAKATFEFDVNGVPNEAPEVFNAYTQAVTDKLFGWYQTQIESGVRPGADELQGKLQQISQDTYYQYYTKDNEPRLSNMVTSVKNAKGQSVFVAENIRPQDLDFRTSNSLNSRLLSKEETLANLERYRDGLPATQRVVGLYRQNDKAFLRQQAQHWGIDPTPYIAAERGQQEDANRRAAPSAASRYYSSSDTLRQARSLREIAEATARQQRQVDEYGPQAPRLPSAKGPKMSDVNIYSMAISQGLSEKNAVIMTAIALAESSGIPGNTNFNRSTGDQSYGLWQINMIDNLGPERAKALGLNDYNQLLDPVINSKAMKYVLGRQGFGAWSVYRNGTYRQYLPDAERARIKAKQGLR